MLPDMRLLSHESSYVAHKSALYLVGQNMRDMLAIVPDVMLMMRIGAAISCDIVPESGMMACY